MFNALLSPLGIQVTDGHEKIGRILAVVVAFAAAVCGYHLYFDANPPAAYAWGFTGAASLLVVGGAVRFLHLRQMMFIVALLGLPLMAFGWWLHGYESEQVSLYNKAMVAYDKHDWAAATKLLDESSAAFQKESNRSRFMQLVLPAPHRDVEARVHNTKGVMLVMQNKYKEAVKEFFTSLQLNPGNRYVGLSAEEAAVWENDARKPKANLEKLYKQGKADGRAKGKQGSKQGQPGPGEPQPGPPQPGAGHNGPGRL